MYMCVLLYYIEYVLYPLVYFGHSGMTAIYGWSPLDDRFRINAVLRRNLRLLRELVILKAKHTQNTGIFLVFLSIT